MEVTDELVERQQLVQNDVEIDEEQINQMSLQNPSKPASPVANKKISTDTISIDTNRSRNTASCSIEQTTSDRGETSTRVTYINERKQKTQEENKFDYKSRPRTILKDCNRKKSLAANSDKFEDRPIKHHSFVSEVPDVKHMERALLGLLDDFHSGKLKAFGSGCSMEQMTKIREQQESLAKLHFELASAGEECLENGNDTNAAKAQENMMQLVHRLEKLSISIEQLQSSHTAL